VIHLINNIILHCCCELKSLHGWSEDKRITSVGGFTISTSITTAFYGLSVSSSPRRFFVI